MEKDYYINIQSFMVQDLKLSGNELLTYAIVYGFSQDGESVFLGSSKYVSYALGISRTTAIKALDGLTDKGLIIKFQEKINDVVFNRYKVSLQAIKNLDSTSTETVQGGYTETGHSNKDKDINIKNNKKKVSKSETYDDLIESYTDDDDLRQSLKAFIQMRKLIKKPLTNYALKLILNKLDKMSADSKTKTAIVNQSVEHSWQGVFPLKEEKKADQQTYCMNESKQDETKPEEPNPQDFYDESGNFKGDDFVKACDEYHEAWNKWAYGE